MASIMLDCVLGKQLTNLATLPGLIVKKKKEILNLGMIIHTHNLNTWNVETRDTKSRIPLTVYLRLA
jgi:hypothetical protein